MKQMSRIREHAILRNQRIPNRRPEKEPMATEGFWEDDAVKEKVVIRDDHPDQPIIINGKLSNECKQKLGEVLQKNVDVFAWTQIVSTALPRFIMEHQLNAYPLSEPVIHKKWPLNPDQRRVLKEKVFEWLKAGIIRKVQYPGWVANAMPIKLRDDTWKVHLEYSCLNKVCVKDMSLLGSRGETKIARRASVQMLLTSP
ncbi:hypothetical protein Tco_1409661 [Tanacetum coccineum]